MYGIEQIYYYYLRIRCTKVHAYITQAMLKWHKYRLSLASVLLNPIKFIKNCRKKSRTSQVDQDYRNEKPINCNPHLTLIGVAQGDSVCYSLRDTPMANNSVCTSPF